jgi:predicted nucleotidyltransferase
MRTAAPALLPILRSQVAGNLLALLYLHPDQEYSLSEAAQMIGSSVNAVHHEASRLTQAGLLRDRRRGNLRLIRADADSLLARPLTDLMAVTYGPLPVITELLRGVDGVEEAYIYGSWAARYQGEPGPPPNDVDVLVVGSPALDDLDDAAEKAEDQLRRPVNIRRVKPVTWHDPDPADPFLLSVRTRPLVELSLREDERQDSGEAEA